MFAFTANNIHEATQVGLEWLLTTGIEENSRAGRVLVAPEPVCTTYLNPEYRVVLSPTRDANPFFHFMESLWMLSGSNEIAFPTFFNKPFADFSDDGSTQWGAYGWRWRQFFGWDQLTAIVEELRNNPTSRRCVLTMWNAMPGGDSVAWDDFYVATHGGKDVPCNTHVYFDCRGGVVNMTVCCRSNDVIWGCYGANIVHMTMMLEYVAEQVGLPMGQYRQFSNNFHAYLDRHPKKYLGQVIDECSSIGFGPTIGPAIGPEFSRNLLPFMNWANRVINNELEALTKVPVLQDALLNDVAVPMFVTWARRKANDPLAANACVKLIKSNAWRQACQEWISRRA